MRIDTSADFQQFVTLLAAEDPPDLRGVVGPDVRRGSRVTQLGDYTRRSSRGLPLLVAWYVRRVVMKEEGEYR